MNYTYMLQCGDGSLYTGWTNDPARRLAVHQAGRGGKYTRSRLPVELVWLEEWPTKEEAMAREWAVKQLTRRQKLALVEAYKKSRKEPCETF